MVVAEWLCLWIVLQNKGEAGGAEVFVIVVSCILLLFFFYLPSIMRREQIQKIDILKILNHIFILNIFRPVFFCVCLSLPITTKKT